MGKRTSSPRIPTREAGEPGRSHAYSGGGHSLGAGGTADSSGVCSPNDPQARTLFWESAALQRLAGRRGTLVTAIDT